MCNDGWHNHILSIIKINIINIFLASSVASLKLEIEQLKEKIKQQSLSIKDKAIETMKKSNLSEIGPP